MTQGWRQASIHRLSGKCLGAAQGCTVVPTVRSPGNFLFPMEKLGRHGIPGSASWGIRCKGNRAP